LTYVAERSSAIFNRASTLLDTAVDAATAVVETSASIALARWKDAGNMVVRVLRTTRSGARNLIAARKSEPIRPKVIKSAALQGGFDGGGGVCIAPLALGAPPLTQPQARERRGSILNRLSVVVMGASPDGPDETRPQHQTRGRSGSVMGHLSAVVLGTPHGGPRRGSAQQAQSTESSLTPSLSSGARPATDIRKQQLEAQLATLRDELQQINDLDQHHDQH
jgi:hypothetical protein